MADHGMLLIISGPSGVGKTTIAHRVEKEIGGEFSVSVTTRPQAEGDVDRVDYHFVTREEFERMRERGDLLEWAPVFDNFYGTPRKPVEAALCDGRLMILEIDIAGATQVKQKLPDLYGLFILPPSEEVLLERLRSRRRDSEAVIQRRFARAKDEIARSYDCGVYSEHIVNDDLDAAVEQAVKMVRREMARRSGR